MSLSYCYHYYYYSACDSCVLWCIICHYNCYDGVHVCGPNDAWCSSASTVAPRGHNEGLYWPHHCATATISLSPRCLLRHLPTVPFVLLSCVFFFRDQPPTNPLCCMLLSVIVFAVCFQVPMWLPCSQWGLNHLGLHHCNTLENRIARHMCLQVMVHSSYRDWTEWLIPPLLWVWGASYYLSNCPPSIPLI